LKHFEADIETITLIPSDSGKFEVVVNEVKLYSKLATGRHANPGEVVDLVRNFLKKNNF
jgi:selenoprotein W-related protein